MRPLALLVAALASGPAAARSMPLAAHPAVHLRKTPVAIPFPRPRPRVPSAAPAPPAAVSAPSVVTSPQPSDCRQQLSSGIADIVALPPVHGPGGCRIDDPVRLEAIRTRSGNRIALTPAAVLGCPLARALTDFVREDAGPTLAQPGRTITRLNIADSFDCRSRNGVSGAKVSEHGYGNAVDLYGVTFSDGRAFVFTDAGTPRDTRTRIRELACARFMTVLGPGSDGYHEQHVHLDLAPRHNSGYRICHWEIR